MSYLIRVALKPERVPQGADAERFPFSVRAIRTFDGLDLSAPVTFFVGENGSGKSTLLEAIAIAAEVQHLGTEIIASRDITLEHQRKLASAIRLSWSPRTRRGFFLRAEDFFASLRSRGAMEVESARAFAGLDRNPTPESEAE
ncbi:MAG: AAA family ATPase, partial [Polyangiaceae bacterium]